MQVLLQLDLRDGGPLYLNPKHIVAVFSHHGNTNIRTTAGGSSDTFVVEETVEEVVALITSRDG